MKWRFYLLHPHIHYKQLSPFNSKALTLKEILKSFTDHQPVEIVIFSKSLVSKNIYKIIKFFNKQFLIKNRKVVSIIFMKKTDDFFFVFV